MMTSPMCKSYKVEEKAMLGEVWELVRGRTVKPAVSNTFQLDGADDGVELGHEDGEPDWQDALTPIAGVPCVIGYTNAKSIVSQRLITCQRQDQHGDELYLWAFCHERGAVRQFKVSRITEVFDAATGEASHPDVFFADYRIDRTQRSKPGWGLSVKGRGDFTSLLNSIVFLAKCDQEYHHLKRSTLETLVERYWLRFEAPGDPDCDAIMAYADRLAPDAEIFFVSLHRCIDDPRLARLLRESARDMIDADGRVCKEEVYWGGKIDQLLSASA